MSKRRPCKHLIKDVEFIECPYCGEPFQMLHWGHLKKLHGKSIEDVRTEYPDYPTMTLNESNKRSNTRIKCDDKITKTCNEKYGGVGFKSNNLNEKTINSIKDKFGVDNVMRDKGIAKRVGDQVTKEANPNRAKKISKSLQGWDNPNKGKTYEEIYGKEKAKELIKEKRISGLKGHMLSPSTSKPQLELYAMVKEHFPDAKLELPFAHAYSLDIALVEQEICIEYDGSYWHNEEKDKERDEFLEMFGWKTIRFIDRLPTEKELLQKINEIIKSKKYPSST